jgi:DNA gyrase subunit B
MYIGSADARGLFHILFELVTNSLAEAVAGYGRSVRVTLRTDGSAEVADDGRVLPSDVALEQVLTVIGAGHSGSYCPYPGGRDYFGYTVANALSEWLRVVVRSDGSRYQHGFRRGATAAVVQSGGPPGDRGLTVAFRPDSLIFGDAQFDSEQIRYRLRQLAFLHSGVRITFTDEITGMRDEFEYADGIRECVRFLSAGRPALHADPIMIRGEEQGVRYEVGLLWGEDGSETRMSFANHYYTRDGGTHDRGLCSGAAAAVRDFIRASASERGELTRDDLCAGLTAVVSVWLSDPHFEGATRWRLGSPEVEAVVSRAVRRGVCEYFEANREVAERVVSAVVMARDARVAAMAVRKRTRKRGSE